MFVSVDSVVCILFSEFIMIQDNIKQYRKAYTATVIHTNCHAIHCLLRWSFLLAVFCDHFQKVFNYSS